MKNINIVFEYEDGRKAIKTYQGETPGEIVDQAFEDLHEGIKGIHTDFSREEWKNNKFHAFVTRVRCDKCHTVFWVGNEVTIEGVTSAKSVYPTAPLGSEGKLIRKLEFSVDCPECTYPRQGDIMYGN